MDVIRLRDTLVTLTMIIRTNIKDSVVITVIPPDQFIIFLDE